MKRSLAALIATGLAAAVATGGCFPAYDDRPWLVDEPRILAIRSTPAEQRPRMPIELSALVATPTGSASATGAVSWTVCTEPRRAEERGAVSEACALGTALTPTDAATAVLADACARFGPNPPPAAPGEPPRRPADPDPSGGYFMPVRAALDDGTASFGFVRVRCDLAGATRRVFEQYQARYTMNENPELAELALESLAGEPVEADPLAPGELVRLVVRPAAGAAEPFVLYHPDTNILTDERERLTAHWYATAGAIDPARLTVTDGATLTATWRAPDTPTPTPTTSHIWVVVRDSRGGVAWAERTVTVGR